MPPASRKLCDYPGCTSGPLNADQQPTPFITSEDNTKKEEVSEELKNHMERAHLLPIRLAENATKAREVEALVIQANATLIREETAKLRAQQQLSEPSSPTEHDRPSSLAGSTSASNASRKQSQDKRDSLPRPTIEENASVSDWQFFKSQWSRYKTAANLTKTQQIHHLWAACTPSLQHSLHSGNADSISEPDQLIETIRLLAVKRKNNLVHIV